MMGPLADTRRTATVAEDPETPETREENEAPEDEGKPVGSFSRCATCRNSSGVDIEKGTLLCKRFNMLVDADADEIPDDCLEYDRDPDREPPPDPTEEPPAGELT